MERRKPELVARLRTILAVAPLFTPTMPRSGKPFSVRMTNCGPLGWVSDASGGYRYQATHPETGKPGRRCRQRCLAVARGRGLFRAAEACLVNYYAADAKMGLHRDEDEQDLAAPVLSVSLGDTAIFRVGGLTREVRRARSSSSPAMWSWWRRGSACLSRHRPHPARHLDLLPEGGRFNLTLRRVTKPN